MSANPTPPRPTKTIDAWLASSHVPDDAPLALVAGLAEIDRRIQAEASAAVLDDFRQIFEQSAPSQPQPVTVALRDLDYARVVIRAREYSVEPALLASWCIAWGAAIAAA